MTRHSILVLAFALVGSHALAAQPSKNDNHEKLADDPTKVITKVGISYANNLDFNDDNVSFSGSLAFDEARKLNVRVNSDASEWRVGGSWLFPMGIVNFNFGKNEYTNGADQTNYSIGSFMPLSYFGIQPAGVQIFPTAGYTYNDGKSPRCTDASKSCSTTGVPTAENGFTMVDVAGSSAYLGAFALKPLSSELTLMGVTVGTYGSENDEGKNYKGYFAALGLGYLVDNRHSFNIISGIMDNNTYLNSPDQRLILSYTYQFN
ncbi:hypothetical protein ACBZ91_18515 [Vibrio natriegens]|uniref:hypothetical protein n=1 Tax=Vibrio natriegens TaxID=691 RepID=UPI003558FDEB